MSRAPKIVRSRLEQHSRTLCDIIQSLARRHGLWRVWSDFVEMSAIALARMDRSQFKAREERYRQIAKQYTDEELQEIAHAFAALTAAYEDRFKPSNGEKGLPYTVDFSDVLGQLYMQLDLGNTQQGQFFTPYEVSLLNAKLCLTNPHDLILSKGFLTLQEPASGSGGMIIACAQHLAELGLDYQKVMHVTGIDINPTCVHMSFVQCALLSIPALIVHGNTLAASTNSVWATPAHFLGMWDWRLRREHREVEAQERAPESLKPKQLELLPKAA